MCRGLYFAEIKRAAAFLFFTEFRLGKRRGKTLQKNTWFTNPVVFQLHGSNDDLKQLSINFHIVQL